MRSMLARITFGRVAAMLTIVGALSLSYVAGAAVMYFRLPTSDFLWNAFSGAGDLSDASKPDAWEPGSSGNTVVAIHKAGASKNEYLLVGDSASATARLIDMDGHVVHRWQMTAPRTWTNAPHVRDAKIGDPFHWERCLLYPNGDLLVMCCSDREAPYGYALAKFDKDSKLLWAYPANVHHDVNIDENGMIYVLSDKLVKRPAGGSELFPKEFLAECLVILKPDGEHYKTISLLEKFQDSKYALTLLSGPGFGVASTTAKPPMPPGMAFPPPGAMPTPGHMPPTGMPPLPGGPAPANAIPDPFHANSVRVLSAGLASKFPLLKAGQVLISLRNPSALLVVDPQTESVVWADKGPWMYQHDAQFLSNGNLLLFDNSGSPLGSRVLEYDPKCQAVDWFYGGDKETGLNVPVGGNCERLANGNTLVVDQFQCRVLEVNAGKEVVWQWSAKTADTESGSGMFTIARRYPASKVSFLKQES